MDWEYHGWESRRAWERLIPTAGYASPDASDFQRPKDGDRLVSLHHHDATPVLVSEAVENAKPVTVTGRLRVGVVGAGLIAQVAHLPYLRELDDRFEIAAIADHVPETARSVAERYGVPYTTTDWRALLDEQLDAVLVLTSGSHAPIAIAAAERGLHVLVEKPMCFALDEGRAMVAAADTAGVTLMVGYNKRYDAAYERFAHEVATLAEPRFVRVTTFEAPFLPYLGHYPLVRPVAPPSSVADQMRRQTDELVTQAIGKEATEFERRTYRSRLLDSLVHELSALRGLLGEPDRLEHVELRESSLTVLLSFDDVPAAIHWILLAPGITRYQMEFAVSAPDRRLTLTFPSPYLRNNPTMLRTEEGEPDSPGSRATEEITTFEHSFKRELIAFHAAATGGPQPVTSGADSLRDVALCQAIIRAHRSGRPIERPSEPA